MIHVLDPRFWLGLVALAGATFFAGNLQGHYAEKKAWERREAIKEAQEYKKYAEDVSKSREALERLQKDLSQIRLDKQKEQEYAKAQLDSMRRDITSGSFRLSVPINQNSTSPFSISSRPGDGAARAELLPETSLDLINLAADADEEVRRTNECIAKYNAVKRQSEREKDP